MSALGLTLVMSWRVLYYTVGSALLLVALGMTLYCLYLLVAGVRA